MNTVMGGITLSLETISLEKTFNGLKPTGYTFALHWALYINSLQSSNNKGSLGGNF